MGVGSKFGILAETGNNIVTDGLVFNMDAAAYKSYPRTGTNVYNLASGSLTPTGSLENGVGWEGINPTSSFTFDGNDDYINLGSSLEINTDAAWSVSFWANLDAYSPAYPAPFTLATDESQGFCCFFSNGGSYKGINFGANTQFLNLKTDGDISASLVGAWNNIILTYNGSGKTTQSNYTIYVNGVVVANATSGGYASVTNTSLIGRIAASNTFNGGIANFLVYNRVLSASDVLQNYNAGKDRFGL